MPDKFTPVIGERRGTGGHRDPSELSPSPGEEHLKRAPTSLMLDPSVLFRPRADVLTSLQQARDALGVSRIVTPAHFMVMLEANNQGPQLRALGGPAGIAYDAGEVLETIRDADVVAFHAPPSASDDYQPMRANLELISRDPVVASIRFEEWFYLTHNSMLVSRLKRPFSQMARAGAVVVELLTPLGNRVVRRTLKMDKLEEVTRAHALRALGKWVAVGGNSALAFVSPWAAAAGALATNSFLLVDP
jgi:hypothetical protein